MNPEKQTYWALAIIPTLLTQALACAPQNPIRADPTPTPHSAFLPGERSLGPVSAGTIRQLRETGASLTTIMPPSRYTPLNAFTLTNRDGEICLYIWEYSLPTQFDALVVIAA